MFCHSFFAQYDRNPPRLGPLHLTGETQRGGFGHCTTVCLLGIQMTWPCQNDQHFKSFGLQNFAINPKITPLAKCICVNPHCLCVTPFNAKLAWLTVGYSHLIRPPDGSILTRFNPRARSQLLSVIGHLFQQVSLNFLYV